MHKHLNTRDMTYDELGVDLETIRLVKRIIENPEVNEIDTMVYKIICKLESELEVMWNIKIHGD